MAGRKTGTAARTAKRTVAAPRPGGTSTTRARTGTSRTGTPAATPGGVIAPGVVGVEAPSLPPVTDTVGELGMETDVPSLSEPVPFLVGDEPAST